MLNPGSTHFVIYFLRAYPLRTAAATVLLLVAGLAEGVGIATLLPVLEVALRDGALGDGAASRLVLRALRLFGATPTLANLLGLVVVALTAKAALRWLALREVNEAVAAVARDLRLRLLRALMAARWIHFTSEPAGHFASAVGMEAHRASFAYREACSALATAIQIAVYAAVAVLVSWRLALLALAAGVTLTLLLSGFVRASRRAGAELNESLKALVARVTDAVQGMKAIRAMGRERAPLALLERETGRLERAERRLALVHDSLHSLHEPILAVVVALGVYGAATWGEQSISAVILMVFLLHRIVVRFHLLQTEYQRLAGGESAFWSLDAQARAAEAARESTATAVPQTLARGIALRKVAFNYEGEPILREVSLEIPAGSYVAIVGRSGAGKTTLVDLILGLHRPTAGEILVDDMPLRELDLHAWRRSIGYIPQDTVLLHDTVAWNVSLGLEDVGAADIEAALRAAGAWEFVDRLPEGPATIVGERGYKFSGGERQRIAIARALVGRPTLLVLDEATSGVDAESARAVRETLRTLRGRVTILAVSHAPPTDPPPDAVYEVSAGTVREVLPVG